MEQTSIDRELEQAIDPWLEHMRWRSDFKNWREERIWQENKQQAKLATLETFLRLADKSIDAPASIPNLSGLKVLDLGCGMGGLSVALALRGATVTPFDFNPAYCHITQLRGDRYGLRLNPVNGAGEKLPFPADYFDVVMCMDVLEHVQKPESLLSEVSRTLQAGGLLYLTAINRLAFDDPHYHVKGVNWLPRGLAKGYLQLVGRSKDNSRFKDNQTLEAMHYFRYGELSKLAARHNFKKVFEYGEVNLNQPTTKPSLAKKKETSGLKEQAVQLLRATKLLGPVYQLYRNFYKGTYQLALIKS